MAAQETRDRFIVEEEELNNARNGMSKDLEEQDQSSEEGSESEDAVEEEGEEDEWSRESKRLCIVCVRYNSYSNERGEAWSLDEHMYNFRYDMWNYVWQMNTKPQGNS